MNEPVISLGELEEQEVFFICPYCGEQISMLIDISAGDEEYIEDCEVCCKPIQLNYEVEGEKIADFVAGRVS